MTGPWAALTARHSTVPAILAVGATFAIAALAVALSPQWNGGEQQAPASRVQPHPPLLPLIAPLRLRCTTCGVIEAIVITEAADNAPLSWQFAVRMQDGSLRHSSDSLPGRWQVGDRIQLLGGGTTWSEP